MGVSPATRCALNEYPGSSGSFCDSAINARLRCSARKPIVHIVCPVTSLPLAGRPHKHWHCLIPPDKSDYAFLPPSDRAKTDNESVYKGGRNVHIEFLHSVTLCNA